MRSALTYQHASRRKIDGDWPGELHALMLDAKGTFDDLVSRYSNDAAQARRILENPFYQNIAGALSGTHEYMAMEKLYELRTSGAYDLVVVDTPPTRHALAFLDAPRSLIRLLDNRIYRLLMAPRGLVRTLNSAAQLFARQITKVVGGEVIDDALGVLSGVRRHGGRLQSPGGDDDATFELQ